MSNPTTTNECLLVRREDRCNFAATTCAQPARATVVGFADALTRSEAPALPGLAGNASFASALPNAAPNPMSEGQAGAQAGSQAVRPQPIDRGLDGWFLDRLFGRR